MATSNTGIFTTALKQRTVGVGESTVTDHYHIRFETCTVGPKILPTFAYTCAVIYYDHIVYTAIVETASVEDAVARVLLSWPDGRIHKVVKGRNSFTQEDKDIHATTSILGVMSETRPKTKTKRFFYFFFPSWF